MPSVSDASVGHVGIGWRHAHYAELLERSPPLDFLEVHSENFFAEGGAALAVLDRGRAQYPISLHGVGLSLGSAAGVDAWHLDQLACLVRRVDPVRVRTMPRLHGASSGEQPCMPPTCYPFPSALKRLTCCAPT